MVTATKKPSSKKAAAPAPAKKGSGRFLVPEKEVKRKSTFVRPKSQYDNEQHAGLEGGGRFHDHTINPRFAKEVEVMRPDMRHGPCIFRPWPSIEEGTRDVLEHGRKGAGDAALTNWIVSCPSSGAIGLESKHLFWLYMPYEADQRGHDNPYARLYWACWKAKKEGRFFNRQKKETKLKWDGDWNKLLDGKTGQGAPIPRPTVLYSMQGECSVNGETNYWDDRTCPMGRLDEDKVIVLRVSKSGGESVYSVCKRRVDDIDPDAVESGRWDEVFHIGNPVGDFDEESGRLKGGYYFAFFDPKQAKPQGDEWIDPILSSWNGESSDFPKHHVLFSETFRFRGKEYAATIGPNGVINLLNKSKPWFETKDDEGEGRQDGILYNSTFDEQCLWIADAFAPVARVVEYAWADFPEYLRAEGVMKTLRKAKSLASPGMPDEGEGEDEEPDEDEPRKGRQSKGYESRGLRNEDVEEEEEEEEEEEQEPGDEEEVEEGEEEVEEAEASGDEEETEEVEEDEEELRPDDGEIEASDEDEEGEAEEDEEEASDEDEPLTDAEFDEMERADRKARGQAQPAAKKPVGKVASKTPVKSPAKKSPPAELEELDDLPPSKKVAGKPSAKNGKPAAKSPAKKPVGKKAKR